MISHPDDLHAARVLELLRRDDHPVLLLNFLDFPERARLRIEYNGGLRSVGYRHDADGEFNLSQVRSAWWRRPQAPDLRSIHDGDARAFTHNEWHEAISGLYQLLDVPWMNPPARDDVASRKLLQLKVAAEAGLTIPRTLVTTDAEAARDFIGREGIGRTIYKTFSCTHEVWRETRLVTDREMDLLSHLQVAPVIFQEYLKGGTDLRVTIVGGRVFAAAIYAQGTTYPVDFRMSLGQAHTEAVELPTSVISMIQILMKRLGLVYGAVDLRHMPDGRYVFLEVNTAGEFLFIEERTGQPITRAIADWLTAPS